MKRTPPWVFVAAVGVQLAALGLCVWAMERNLPAEAEAPAPPPEPEPPSRDALASGPPAAQDVAFVREPPWAAPWRDPEPVVAQEREPEWEPLRAPEPDSAAPEVRPQFEQIAGVEVDVEVLLEAETELEDEPEPEPVAPEPEPEPEPVAAEPEPAPEPRAQTAPAPRFSEPPAAVVPPRWTAQPEPEPPRRVTIRAVEPPYSSTPRFGPPPERPPEPPPDPDAIPHFITDLADATSQVVGGRVGERRFAFGFYPDGNIRFVDVDGGRYAGKAESARARMREVDGMRAFTVQIGVGEDRRLQATFTGGLHDAETIALEPLVGWSVA